MGATPTLTPLEAPTATCCAHCGRERWEGASTITTPAGTPTRKGSSTTQSSARAPAFAPRLGVARARAHRRRPGGRLRRFGQRRSARRSDPQHRRRGDRHPARDRLRAAKRQGGTLGGLAVVAAIFVSACVAGYEAVDRLVPATSRTWCRSRRLGRSASRATGSRRYSHPCRSTPRERGPCGRRRPCPPTPMSRWASWQALGCRAGPPLADPLIALAICGVILRITCCPETFDGRVDALRGPWEELTSV